MGEAAREKPIMDPRISASIGYAESKWIAETIVLNALREIGLRASVVRVGQLAGDTRYGGWNKQEWVGAITRVSQIVQAFPERTEVSVITHR